MKSLQYYTQTMDGVLTKLAGNAISSLLGDPSTEEKEVSSDRVGGIISSNATVIGQAEVNEQTVFNPSGEPTDRMRSQGFKNITAAINPGKLVSLGTAEWTGNQEYLDPIHDVTLPQDFYARPSQPASGQSKYFKYVRTGYTFNIQVNASVGVSGSLLVYYVPDGVDTHKLDLATVMLYPYVLINVGVASNGVLVIPFTSHMNYVSTDSGEGGKVHVIVWSKLKVPSGTANAMSVSIFGSMDNLDFQNPRPVTQGPTRNTVDIGPGPGNLPLASGIYTNKGTKLALCGEVTEIDNDTCGCSAPIRDLYQLLSVPLPVVDGGTGQPCHGWAATDPEGTLLMTEHLSMRRRFATAGNAPINGLTDFLSNCYGFWRGSIVFTLTVFGNPLSRGRLRMAIYPNTTAGLVWDNIDNALYVVCDIGLQTSFELVLPYSSKTWLTATQRNDDGHDVYAKLGVFVANRLIVTAATPPAIDFMVTARVGPDFEFFAPMTRGVHYQADEPTSVAASGVGAGAAAAAGLDVLENSDYKNTQPPPPQTLNAEIIPVTTIRADHMRLDNLLARGQRIGEIDVTTSGTVWSVPVPTEGFMSILKLFAYWAGDLTISVWNATTSGVTVSHSYCENLQSSSDIATCCGCVIVKPGEFAALDCPFYSRTPLRLIGGGNPFGRIITSGFVSGKMEVYLSFRRLSLFFPVGVPKHATVASFLKTIDPHTMRTSITEAAMRAIENNSLDSPLRSTTFPPSKCALMLMAARDQLFGAAESDWVPDLTEEGVEPNPGPLFNIRTLMNADMLSRAIAAINVEPVEEGVTEEALQLMTASLPGVDPMTVMRHYHDKHMAVPQVLSAEEKRDLAINIAWTQHCKNPPKLVYRTFDSLLGPDIEYGIWCDGQVLLTCEWGYHYKFDIVSGQVLGETNGESMWRKVPSGATANDLMKLSPAKRSIWDYEFAHLSPFPWSPLGWIVLYQRLASVWAAGDSAGGWLRDLTLEGIEPNPGPRCHLVYMDRGLYRHYGVLHGQEIIHMSSDNILEAARTGQVPIVTSPFTPEWVVETSTDISELQAMALQQSVGEVHHFSGDANCEIFAKEALGIESVSQGRALAVYGIIIATVTGAYATQSKASDLLRAGKSVAKDASDAMSRASVHVLDTMKGFFMDEMVSGIKCDIIKALAKLLVRMVCYGILFCGNPGVLSGLAVASLVAMDLTAVEGLTSNVKILCNAMVEGDMTQMVEAMTNLITENSPDREDMAAAAAREFVKFTNIGSKQGAMDGIKDFNTASLGARNFEFWLSKLEQFWKWLKSWLAPTDQDKAIQYFKDNEEKILALMATGDRLIIDSQMPNMVRNADYQTEVKTVCEMLAVVKEIALRGRIVSFISTISGLLLKLSSIPKPPKTSKEALRQEPIGIYVAGTPGCGKSSFAFGLMTLVAEKLEAHAKRTEDEELMSAINTCYSHPIGSAYFDNYEGQFFHFYDDFGQNRDEEDVATICNVISSVPFSVPMADLSTKGTYYKSKIVVATTNMNSFSNLTTVISSEAVSRRFPFKFWIRPTKDYADRTGKLDLKRAVDSGAVRTGEAWEWTPTSSVGQQMRPVDLDEIAHDVACEFIKRQAVVGHLRQSLARFNTSTVTRVPSDTSMVSELALEAEILAGEKKQPVAKYKMDGDGTVNFGFAQSGNEEDVTVDDVYMQRMEERLDQLVLRLGGISEASPFASMVNGTSGYVPTSKPGPAHRSWWKEKMKACEDMWDDAKPWLILAGVVLGVIGTAFNIYWLVKHTSNPTPVPMPNHVGGLFGPEDPQRPYGNGTVKANRVAKRTPVVVTQGLSSHQEFNHIHSATGYMTTSSGETIFIFGYCGNRALMYSHAMDSIDVVSITYKGVTHPITNADLAEIPILTQSSLNPNMPNVGDKMLTDTCLVEIAGLPFTFKDMRKHIAPARETKYGYLLYTNKYARYTQLVEDIKPQTILNLHDFHVDSSDGIQMFYNDIRYRTKNEKGMCGGIVVQKSPDGAWKAVGMHHAGDAQLYGFAAQIHMISHMQAPPKSVENPFQGVVVSKEVSDTPVFTPTRSKIKKSPLYGVFEPKMGPAPLHPKDKRIEDGPEHLLKAAASKYRVDHFSPDPLLFNEAEVCVTRRLFAATGRNGCWDMITALNGDEGSNKIDLTTSAGPKYAAERLKKTDLVQTIDGVIVPTPRFAQDVENALQAIREGKGNTQFCATLKDEVIKDAKIKAGKARCIEACSFDYTVAHRMILGPIFSKIYSADSVSTGIAVGINPYTQFHGLAGSMKKHWLAVDYAAYDGSLSKDLMEAGVEVLAACHEEPQLVRRLLAPVVNSVHLVGDEIWRVQGGMPSGSPCTSVLNSVCNCLVMTTCMLGAGMEEAHDLTIVTYGDDVLASVDEPVDTELVCQLIKEWFGMDATSADKQSFNLNVKPQDATFLKRAFRYFPGTQFVTGVLDLNSMTQKIMWCHGLEEFKSQLTNFVHELVLHGPEVYAEVITMIRPRLDEYKLCVPSYEQAYKQVYSFFFQ